ncbi:hypothetical protein [Ferrimonas sp. YFM]|uniref:hypothetical protein n=1 Tax=Ferrimonas sp. YFM TaxID=3028878 RepID=UPI002572C9AA|nr:hypothetical protein [Ferrimonas sp. YFM]BDY06863.1 hypothetical protein F0521_39040 [Ferrimonas sp. YFM]
MITLAQADRYHLEFKVVLPPGVRRAQWQAQLLLPPTMASDGSIPTADRFYRNLLQQQRLVSSHPPELDSVKRFGRLLREGRLLKEPKFKRLLADLINGLLTQFLNKRGEALLACRRQLRALLFLKPELTQSWQKRRFKLARQLLLFHFQQALLRELHGARGPLRERIKRHLRVVGLYAQRYRVALDHPEEAGRERMLERLTLSQRVLDRPYQLNRRQSRDTKLAEQLIFGLAAALAMAFATAIAFATQQAFGNFSTPFFFSLVFSYIFKDRIKELGRNFLVDKFYARFYQRHYLLFQPGIRKNLVEIRDSYFQPKGKELDCLVSTAASRMTSGETLRIDGAWVYRRAYRCSRELGSNSPYRFHDNLTLNLSRPLRLLPSRIQSLWREESHQPRRVDVHRVTSLYLMLHTQHNQINSLKIFRIQVSRRGIHRIKEVQITPEI